jgi:hypothetical protein
MTREEKIERYVDAVVQNMDWKTMYTYCYESIYDTLNSEPDEYVEDLYNEYFEDNDEETTA